MDITKRHEATLAGSEANRPDDVDMDPTYSDRSESPIASGSQSKPKKQKVAVSKKDYEDLARFIVDNIAEGDVPDSKDFAAFSKDVSHPLNDYEVRADVSIPRGLRKAGIRSGTGTNTAQPSYLSSMNSAAQPLRLDHNRSKFEQRRVPGHVRMRIQMRRRGKWQISSFGKSPRTDYQK
jgi:hypothetical protein